MFVFGGYRMPATDHQLPLKIRASMASVFTNYTAAALTDLPAAFVSFQWHRASQPPTQNTNSAASPVLLDCLSAEVMQFM